MIPDNSLLLLNVLVCPLTKRPLKYDASQMEFVSLEAGIAYPIRDGIPIMIVDEARIIDPEKAARFSFLSSSP